jgi:transcriptional regulator with XRE-family HTH domain
MTGRDPQLGGRIKRLRRSRNVSQSDLAEALGISPSYLNLIEHNRRKVTVPLLFSIAGHFGIEPGELADSDEGPARRRPDGTVRRQPLRRQRPHQP